jgi:uncharacterized Zn-binding protein involved in type VI secretion
MGGKSAARLGDEVSCEYDTHGAPCCPHPVKGRVATGASTVLIEGMPAARLGDVGIAGACCGTNSLKVASGSETVIIEGARAARKGDSTIHCGGAGGTMKSGSPTVFFGSGGRGE